MVPIDGSHATRTRNRSALRSSPRPGTHVAQRVNARSFMTRLLVALDTSDNSSFVLARATELANALGAKIRLLTAVQMPPIVATPPPGPILR